MMGLIVLCLWVPAHTSIRGNKMRDRVAKEITKRSNVDLNININKSEIKGIIEQTMKERWQISGRNHMGTDWFEQHTLDNRKA